MRNLILSLGALVVFLVPAAALAQVCPYGLVAVDAAHCCWPGQTFDPSRGTCAGVPQCPAGLAPYGETCIASNATAQPQPQVQPDGTQPLPPPPPPPTNQPMQPQMQPQMQQLPPQMYGYPVRFEAKKEGHEFTVSVDKGVACRTPCELMVPPGRHKVNVEGDAHFDDRVTFPASPSTVQIEKRRGGGTALGVVSLAIGIPAAVLGAVAGLVGVITSSRSSTSSNRTLMYAGFGVMAAGVTLAAVGGGVGFGIAGKNRVRFARASADEPSDAPVQLVSMGVAPTNGGAMAGATFAF